MEKRVLLNDYNTFNRKNKFIKKKINFFNYYVKR